MRNRYSIVIVALLIFALTTIFFGCVQIPDSNHPQPRQSGNIVTLSPTSEKAGNGIQTGLPGVILTENAGLDYIQLQPSATRRGYVIVDNEYRVDSHTIDIVFRGGQDASYLRYITVSVNGVIVGEMGSPFDRGSLPVGTSGTFSATNPETDHIIGTGHFIDGGTEVIINLRL